MSGLPDEKLGIYSRAMLWNSLAGDNSPFKRFLCWVARYHSTITHPWNLWPAGHMQPWDEYDYWQWSADGNNRGYEFGVDSDDIDLNRKLVDGEEPTEELLNVDVAADKGVKVNVTER